MAAVLACGPGAVLCDRAAAYLLGLIRRQAPPEVAARGPHRVRGVRTRQVGRLDHRDATLWRGIPTTSPARTMVDLAGTNLSDADLARAFHEAGIRHAAMPDHVEEALGRVPTARGAGRLRRITHGDIRVTLSALERRFIRLLEQNGLPLPQTNRPAGTHRVDCRWPELGLTVELDGYRYHRSRHAWEQDRDREREAYARGHQFRRYTYADVTDHPVRMLAELRGLVSVRSRANVRPARR